jgi:hypothetical protein
MISDALVCWGASLALLLLHPLADGIAASSSRESYHRTGSTALQLSPRLSALLLRSSQPTFAGLTGIRVPADQGGLTTIN